MSTVNKLHNWRIEFKDKLPSTQKWLRDHIEAFDCNTAVISKIQTSGKGRLGRSWQSSHVGLYVSLLFKPSPPIEVAPSVSLFVAFLLVQLLKDCGIKAEIKWPNDVIVKNKKIAGIIAESGSFPEQWFVLGIGVNLAGAPIIKDREFLPAGAWNEFGSPPSAIDLLNKLVIKMELVWKDYSLNPLVGLTEEFSLNLWRYNKQVSIVVGKKSYKGNIIGIDTEGALLLNTDIGKQKFITGELKGVDCD